MSQKDDESKKAVTPPAKKYEVIEDYEGDLKGGTEARKYLSDGSIRNEKGWTLEAAPGLVNFTSETGRAAQVKRWSDHGTAFADGISEGLHLPQNIGSVETWREVGKKVGEAIASGNTNRLPELVRMIGELGNFAPSRATVQLLEQEVEPAQHYTPKQLDALADLLEMVKKVSQETREIVEGKVKDVEGVVSDV